MQASVVGNVSVSFFDAEAGWSAVGPVSLAARTQPNVSDTTHSAVHGVPPSDAAVRLLLECMTEELCKVGQVLWQPSRGQYS